MPNSNVLTHMKTTCSEHYINGQWVAAERADLTQVYDSNTNRVIGEAPSGTASDANKAVEAAKAAQPLWAALTASERAGYLRKIASGLEQTQQELAEYLAMEVGSIAALNIGPQTTAPVFSFNTAANIAESFEYRTRLSNSWVVREPIGVVAAITAWNFPLHLATVKAAYALAAGNTVVLKPSEIAPLTAVALARIVDEAELPPGVFNIVFGTGREVGEALVQHPDTRMITFTGSTRAGRRIGEVAAGQVKKVALELGGKSPLLIAESANIIDAVTFGMNDLMVNNGQRCDALTRFVVPRGRLVEVEQAAADFVAKLTVGPSNDPATDIGPVASRRQQDSIREYIHSGEDEGAKLVAGGAAAPEVGDKYREGYFVSPTVFSDVTADMIIAREEIFGPVVVIQPYDSIEHALELANDTIYGLHASVWAGSDEEAMQLAAQIDSGMVTINNGSGNMLAPFGGYKQSGLGREYGSYGFQEFLETKAMHLAATS